MPAEAGLPEGKGGGCDLVPRAPQAVLSPSWHGSQAAPCCPGPRQHGVSPSLGKVYSCSCATVCQGPGPEMADLQAALCCAP